MYTTELGKRRLLHLADFLDHVESRKFNFSIWNNLGGYKWSAEDKEHCAIESPNECGFSACAIGWCPVVFPLCWEYREKVRTALLGETRPFYDPQLIGSQLGPLWDATEFFLKLDYIAPGVHLTSYDIAHALFVGDNVIPWRQDRYDRLSVSATPYEVTQNMRDFIKWDSELSI